jgi:replicative DNA helicase
MLLSRTAVTDVIETLRPEHFYRPNHAEIYRSILNLTKAGEPVDPITVADELQNRALLKRIGGGPYLHDVLEAAHSPGSASYYAHIIYSKWRIRRIVETGQRLVALGDMDATTTEEVEDLIAQADGWFRELSQAKSGLMWDDLIKKWRNWQEYSGDVIRTPWPELNDWFPGRGFHAGQLIIVGGRPGNGKSNAGLNIVLGAAERNCSAVIFSVEMDDVEVACRLLAAGSWSKVSQLFSKKMDDDTKEQVNQYIEEKQGMPLEVVDEPYLSVEDIVAHCRIRRPQIIFVDYTQLIKPTNNKLQREQQVAHVTRSLKIAAKSIGMVVIAASQLKRIDRDRDDKIKPIISDLRESGAAEQDADVVILLHRPANAQHLTAIVGKNRNGPLGEARLKFRGELARVG